MQNAPCKRQSMRNAPPTLDAKVEAWNTLMDIHNTTGKSPMELAETPDGQKVLDEINAKVGASMARMFGG